MQGEWYGMGLKPEYVVQLYNAVKQHVDYTFSMGRHVNSTSHEDTRLPSSRWTSPMP